MARHCALTNDLFGQARQETNSKARCEVVLVSIHGLSLSHAVAMVGSQGLPVRASWMASMGRMPWLRELMR